MIHYMPIFSQNQIFKTWIFRPLETVSIKVDLRSDFKHRELKKGKKWLENQVVSMQISFLDKQFKSFFIPIILGKQINKYIILFNHELSNILNENFPQHIHLLYYLQSGTPCASKNSMLWVHKQSLDIEAPYPSNLPMSSYCTKIVLFW